jgi:hypothetical protein
MEIMYVLVFCATAMLFSVLALGMSFFALAKVIGMEKSTHRIQFEPVQHQMGGPTLEEGIGMNNQTATSMMNKLYPQYEDEV